jgi:hypothetical protein
VNDIGLYDSATGKTLNTLKAVDITDECPGLEPGDRAMLLFTEAQRGRIVQMREGPSDACAMIDFFVDELDREMHVRPMDDTFGVWARRWGVSRDVLRNLIEKHAPAAGTCPRRPIPVRRSSPRWSPARLRGSPVRAPRQDGR